MSVLADYVVPSGIQTGPFGSQLHASDYSLEGVGVVMPQDLSRGEINQSSMARIPSSVAQDLGRHRLLPGDIVYARRGDVTRRALIRETDGELICGTGCLRVRLDQAVVDPRYVAHALGTPGAREWLVRHAVGATMANLNTSILGTLPLALPPRSTQVAIGEVLGALDDKIAANRRVVSAVRDLIDALYASSAKAGTRTFDDVAEVGGGATPSTKNEALWGGPLRWATPSDVTATDGDWLTATARCISEAGFASISSPMYPRGSIFMTSRATVGECVLASAQTSANQGFIVINSKDPRLQLWLFAQMRARRSEFTSWANGATFLELSKKVFRELPVVLPGAQALEEFDETAGPLLRRSEAAQLESEQLAATRDELLPLLMSGAITVKDSEKRVEEEV